MPGSKRSGETSAVSVMVPTVLLTGATGAMDATAFLTLGNVFASVMTGNMVLLGVAAGTRDAELAVSAGLALAGYVVGTLAGTVVSRLAGVLDPRPDRPRRDLLARLLLELALMVAFTVVWEVAGPQGASSRWALLAVAACAMGCQSVAVPSWAGRRGTTQPGVRSTTYMTGTLTGLLADLAGPPGRRRLRGWAAARLVALVCGAVVAAFVVSSAPPMLPAIPVGALLVALAMTVLAPR
ncbi:MAG TPA: YoaK family protein [Nocardioidaceae bacterium]|nr:YoaK family protein [Nocardioidaceae bacterium]